jgi:hypothetical protein
LSRTALLPASGTHTDACPFLSRTALRIPLKVEIRDRAIFQSLSHSDVRAYLAAQSWEEVGRLRNKATVHVKLDAQARQWEILLPSRENVGAYAERMAEA